MKQLWNFFREYGFDVLILSIVEKLINALIKRTNSLLEKVRSAIDAKKEKRATKTP